MCRSCKGNDPLPTDRLVYPVRHLHHVGEDGRPAGAGAGTVSPAAEDGLELPDPVLSQAHQGRTQVSLELSVEKGGV